MKSFCLPHSTAFLLLLFSTVEEIAEGSLVCYNCESWTDASCKDPFDKRPEAIKPPHTICYGLCMKIIQNNKQSDEHVLRACSSDYEIDLSVAESNCLKEGSETGFMCFCDQDHCNASTRMYNSPSVLHYSLLLFLLALFVR